MYFRMYLETAAKFETFFLQRTFLYSFRYTKNGFVVIKIIAQSVFIVFCYQKYKVLLELILEPISSLNFVLEEPPHRERNYSVKFSLPIFYYIKSRVGKTQISSPSFEKSEK